MYLELFTCDALRTRRDTSPLLTVRPISCFYTQAKFTADQHPQYIYSPRELSRWVRALYEAMNPLDAMPLDELVRLWANEALRLFHDRLVTQEERDWCQDKVRSLLLTSSPVVLLVWLFMVLPLVYSKVLSCCCFGFCNETMPIVQNQLHVWVLSSWLVTSSRACGWRNVTSAFVTLLPLPLPPGCVTYPILCV